MGISWTMQRRRAPCAVTPVPAASAGEIAPGCIAICDDADGAAPRADRGVRSPLRT